MRILVVEDDNNIAQNIRQGLLDENFAADVVYDGQEAYDQAKSDSYDAIIMDWMLPTLSGVEVCQRLRADKIYTPVLMLTAKDALEDKVLGLNTGADDYLTKPFSFEELLARVRSLIRRSNQSQPVLKLDSLELDPQAHIVKRQGKEITLTGKEYALLEYFMHHPNQILTRDQILSHVWDYSYDSYSNIIDVLVRRLRNKIDRAYPKDRPLFTTIRGLGYRLGDK